MLSVEPRCPSQKSPTRRRLPPSRAQFDWEDPLLLADELTEEERMVRDAAREYRQDKLASRVKSAFREERFDREIMNEMGALAFLARPSRAMVAPA